MVTARVLALVGVLAAGCGPVAAATPAPALDGAWRVAAIGGEAVPAAAGLTIAFTGGEVRGDTGCNRLSGRYSVEGSRLSVGPIRVTERGCAAAVMAREAKFLRALGTAIRVEAAADGVVLVGTSGERLALVRG